MREYVSEQTRQLNGPCRGWERYRLSIRVIQPGPSTALASVRLHAALCQKIDERALHVPLTIVAGPKSSPRPSRRISRHRSVGRALFENTSDPLKSFHRLLHRQAQPLRSRRERRLTTRRAPRKILHFEEGRKIKLAFLPPCAVCEGKESTPC